MSDEPTDKELADALGISEIQVQIYLSQRGALLTPGCWMLTFSPDTPADLRKKLKLNKALVRTVMLPPRRSAQ
ncbi:hypothetical protein PFAS1_21710 [Pseudomonas frederiksbergensis]|uniref:hypothetical protein n=1 Tax=Pseudomonas frederiksbergensis TaxID=104087 RepID=UPI000957E77B|nr:hypothetical protein [Pseudomonas frederiksbergensis]APV41830.1 hypothetical protein PFAS1_21710 [Pseudomonas frederiksbergensis]